MFEFSYAFEQSNSQEVERIACLSLDNRRKVHKLSPVFITKHTMSAAGLST
jgi:hypothetical protein